MLVEAFNGRPTIQLLVLIAALLTSMWRIAIIDEHSRTAALSSPVDG